MKAAKRGDAAEVARLVEARPRLAKARDMFGKTPLHDVPFRGHREVAEEAKTEAAKRVLEGKPKN